MKEAFQSNHARSINSRSRVLAFLVLFASLCAFVAPFVCTGVSTGIAGDEAQPNRVWDQYGRASFIPPEYWRSWDFYGIPAFSPPGDYEAILTFRLTTLNAPTETSPVDERVKYYRHVFSTKNYEEVLIEPIEEDGAGGIEISAIGAEENMLYPGFYFRIWECYRKGLCATLVFECKADTYERYRADIDSAFSSLIFSNMPLDGRIISPDQ